jgi:hypothetical protein
MTVCERCTKNEEYLAYSAYNQHLCMSWINMVHFGINAPREELAALWCITNVFSVGKYMPPMQKAAFVKNVRLYLVGLQV